MPHNTSIDHVMKDITLKLMSSIRGDACPELWALYPHIQKWTMQLGTRESINTARDIVVQLDRLPDRAIAQEIEETLRHYAPQAFESHGKPLVSASH